MDNECLICFEKCNENVSCCKQNIHLKCLNIFWQYNPNNFNKCPHCNNIINNNINHIIINIRNNQINDNNIQRINNNIQRIDNNIQRINNKCLIFSCSSLMLLLFFISLFSYLN